MGNCSSKSPQGKKSVTSSVVVDKKPPQASGTKEVHAMKQRFQSVYYANQDSSEQNAVEEVENADMRLVNIFSKGVEVPVDFKPPSFAKTKDQIRLIRAAAASNFLFDDLSANASKTIIQAMEPFAAPKGKFIINQGETGDYFYVLEEGTVGFLVDGIRVGDAHAGQSFGELALMYDCPRAASCVIETSACKLWRVDQTLFKQILASQKMQEVSKDVKVLKTVSILKDLEPSYLKKIAYALNRVEYKKGSRIVTKGEVGHIFYIVQSGTVELTDIGLGVRKYEDTTMGVGEFFGERSLLTGDVRAANVTAKTDVVLMEMSEHEFKELLGPIEDIISEITKKKYLVQVPAIKKANPSKEEISLLVNRTHLRGAIFEKDEIIGIEGDQMPEPCIYIIMNGEVSAGSKVLKEGDYFCDDALLEKPAVFSSTFVSQGDGKNPTACAYITLKSFITIFGGISRLKGIVDRRRLSTGIDEQSYRRLTVTLNSLEKMKILGTGTFGKVWLVRHKETDNAWAMKVQKKTEILNYNQVDGVIREKNIMTQLTHPFLINMISAFQDEHDLYMVLNMYPGGELFSLLHRKGSSGVTESSAKFYAGVILEALDFMHLRSILYRDLKPENVLMDADGYCVLIDMGFAKMVEDKTYTLCGTPLYIAPEVILSRGHDKAADIWSLGVLIYEMVYGFTPFYDGNADQMALFKSIVQGRVNFPSSRKSACNDMVSRMLKRRAPFRLGCTKNGAQDIRTHDWFQGFDFDALRKKQIKAPWKPKMKSPFDTRNFDNWSHLEKPEKKRVRLNASQQAKFKEF